MPSSSVLQSIKGGGFQSEPKRHSTSYSLHIPKPTTPCISSWLGTSNQASTKSGTSGAGRTLRYKSTRGSCFVDPTVLSPEGAAVTPTHCWASDRVRNISVGCRGQGTAYKRCVRPPPFHENDKGGEQFGVRSNAGSQINSTTHWEGRSSGLRPSGSETLSRLQRSRRHGKSKS